jgi:hypothetical protein
VLDDETPADAAARIAGEAEVVPDLKDSVARKEYFNALLKELEYREKDGALVDLEMAKGVLYEAAHSARNEWLQWPADVGPLLAADLGVETERVVDSLTAHVHKQLTRLGEPGAEFGKAA